MGNSVWLIVSIWVLIGLLVAIPSILVGVRHRRALDVERAADINRLLMDLVAEGQIGLTTKIFEVMAQAIDVKIKATYHQIYFALPKEKMERIRAAIQERHENVLDTISREHGELNSSGATEEFALFVRDFTNYVDDVFLPRFFARRRIRLFPPRPVVGADTVIRVFRGMSPFVQTLKKLEGIAA